MTQIETIRCPNCGRYGERHYIEESNITRTQCPECDYLLVTCSVTGRVIEAYAPGLSTAFVILHSGIQTQTRVSTTAKTNLEVDYRLPKTPERQPSLQSAE